MSISIGKIIAASPNCERGRPSQLSASPKGDRIAYASGKSIFLRSLDDPSISTQYTPHTTQTTVARFSPSGYYIASGDISGSVRVWDAVEGVNTKGEYHIISGRINDLAWDGDSQRVIAVGDGRERFGHCITADSGNSVGEISGHSGIINSVSIRQQRPLRAATGSDDYSIVFYHGAPFKFHTKIGALHKNYVWGVQFSPDGTHLASVGSDRRIQLYDGKSGEVKAQLGENQHKGSIFALSWSQDSKKLVTSSADQTVKIWDVEAGKAIQTWRFGDEGSISIPDHQVGVVWPAGRSDGMIVSLSLSGDLNYLIQGKEVPARTVQGHNKSITASVFNAQSQTLWTGDFSGRLCSWNVASGIGKTVEGHCHTNQVAGLSTTAKHVRSVAWDDTLRTVDTSTNVVVGEVLNVTSQPQGIAVDRLTEKAYIATAKGIDILANGRLASNLDTKNSSLCVSAHGNLIAVGTDANTTDIYAADDNSGSLKHKIELQNVAQVTAVAFSPDGCHLAVGNSSGKITVFDAKSFKTVTDRWSAHTARVLSIDWNDQGSLAVSGGLDTNVFIWSLKSPGKRIKASNAHKDGVTSVKFIEGGTKVASVGADASIKIWSIKDVE